jgi:carboxylesterase
MGEAPENIYYRRPYSLQQEEEAFHLRDPRTGIILGAEPFQFKGNGAGAVLMVHGYTSTPRDLRELGAALNRAGYTVYGILLPGHGTKPTDLDKVQWTQWYGAVVEAYTALKKEHAEVHAVGFSMGGALAMHLAAHHPVGKLVLLSPLLKIAYNPYHIIPEEWLVYTIGRLLRHLKKKATGNCNDAEARKRHIAYFHYALSSINQALALVNVINREVGKITNPVLIVHGKRDKTTSPAASRRLYDRLPSQDKRFVWLPHANHIITHDYGHETVTGEVLGFLTHR